MVIVAYLCVVATSVIQSSATKLFHRHSFSSVLFNAIKAVTAFVLLALLCVLDFTFHWQTLLLGLCYGMSLCLSMYSGYQALCRGPMALTSMLVSFSVILPFLWGLLVRKELLTMWQSVAFACLLLSLLLLNADKLRCQDKTEKGYYGTWLLCVGVTFLANGICSILQAEHQVRYPGQYDSEFMVVAMLFCSVLFAVFLCKQIPLRQIRSMRGKRYALLSGIANGISCLLTLKLAGVENATVLFPALSAGTLIASLLCGRLCFGEKLKVNHYAALIVGMLSVLLLKFAS